MNRIALLFGFLVMISVACGKSVIKRETETEPSDYEQCVQAYKDECGGCGPCITRCVRDECGNGTEEEPPKRAVREVALVEQGQSGTNQTEYEKCFEECRKPCCGSNCQQCLADCREKCERETGLGPKKRAVREVVEERTTYEPTTTTTTEPTTTTTEETPVDEQ